jgi:hypothetical protein
MPSCMRFSFITNYFQICDLCHICLYENTILILVMRHKLLCFPCLYYCWIISEIINQGTFHSYLQNMPVDTQQRSKCTICMLDYSHILYLESTMALEWTLKTEKMEAVWSAHHTMHTSNKQITRTTQKKQQWTALKFMSGSRMDSTPS